MTEFCYADREIETRAGSTSTILHFRDPDGTEVLLALDGEVDQDFAQRCRIFYQPASPPALERLTDEHYDVIDGGNQFSDAPPKNRYPSKTISLSDPAMIAELLDTELRSLALNA
ncbi:hypothetical protein ACLE20_08320 [Rhizobium sp. YIM 134829]|uniref:hypothetical protein n=1 Tax=Rhizobium sp. YIM 134829 TaxID=3390453 RepID=UPI00397ADB69